MTDIDQLMRLALLAGVCLLAAPLATMHWRRPALAGAALVLAGGLYLLAV